MPPPISVKQLVDDLPFQPLHFAVIAVCFLTAVVDGLDNQMMGFSAPAIAAALKIPISAFGGVFTAGTTGLLAGAMSLGRLADQFGRRRCLIGCTLLFGALSFATALAHTALALSVLRFCGGLGLGGAMPSFLTLVSEYTPKGRRALATGLLWSGYPLGGMIGALFGSYFSSHYSWHAIFYLGGSIALLVAILQWRLLPESLQFLARKGGEDIRIRKILARIAPKLDLSDAIFVAEAHAGGRTSLREVFREGRTLPTVLMWIPLFLTFMLTTFFSLWAPVLFKSSGLTLSTAALMVALYNSGSLPSQAATGHLVDRIGAFRVVPEAFAALAICIALLAFSLKTVPLVAATMVLIGFLLGPGIIGVLYLTTWLYPAHVRSTGVGLAMGIGRSGQVVGTMLIGWAVAYGVRPEQVFLAMAAPPLVALLCVVLLGAVLRRREARPRAALA